LVRDTDKNLVASEASFDQAFAYLFWPYTVPNGLLVGSALKIDTHFFHALIARDHSSAASAKALAAAVFEVSNLDLVTSPRVMIVAICQDKWDALSLCFKLPPLLYHDNTPFYKGSIETFPITGSHMDVLYFNMLFISFWIPCCDRDLYQRHQIIVSIPFASDGDLSYME